ncbi:MAG: molybdopterin molybdotransferase MoeA [Acidimicrobiia bacterium]|nr:molybdopterin molybdotransferase MoeA [Acidimicrobiia bacterium]
MRPLVDAQRAVLAAVKRLPVMAMGLREARGLTLAEAVTAPHDIPPFPNSAMDGYAVRAADVSDVPVVLNVLEDLPAGTVPRESVGPGTAVKIMTGAPMPDGADAIVPVEATDAGSTTVEIRERALAGDHVRLAGGDVVAGTVVLEPGIRLTAAHLGVLASVGAAWPHVHRRPLVGILSTGDELVPPETMNLERGKIRDSNRISLRHVVEEAGAVAVDFGIAPDDPVVLRRALGHAAQECDLVVTSGGVSMGEYDLVKQVLGELGGVDFWKVAMQPGKPFAFGDLDGTPFFGLPGNPVSVMVSFEQFVRPSIMKLLGSAALFRPRIAGTMTQDVVTNPAKTVFVRVATSNGSNGWEATPSGAQGSNVLSALAAADAFAVVDVGRGVVEAGETVPLEMIRWPESRTAEEALA